MKYVKKIIIIAAVIAVIVGLRASGLADFLTFDTLIENRDSLTGFVENNFALAALTYIGIYIVVTGASLPGAAILTLAGGLMFGAVVGTVFVNIAATIGATIAFLLARYLLGNWVHSKYGEKLQKFNKELEINGSSYLLTLRFIPVFPFFLINVFAGVTKIPLKTFLWTTSVGILPGSFVYAFAGQQLNTINSLKDVVSVEILLAFVLLGVFALVPVVYKKFIKKDKSKKE